MDKMMRIALNKLMRDEKGQALILAMILMIVGSLIIAPLLGFMSTGLMAGQVFEKKMAGLYAADAGIEDALWKIINDPPASYPDDYQLTDVNGMSVGVLVEEVTDLYGEEMGGGGIHMDWLELASERVQDPYPGGGDYIHEWRISLTNKSNSNVSIYRITVAYSNELSYLSGLTDEDIAGLNGSFEVFDPNPPVETVVGSSKTLTWEFSPPRPRIDGAPDPEGDPPEYTTVTTIFTLVGPEDAPGISTNIAVARSDIGTIWEFKPFRITATADDGSTVVTTVTARALVVSTMVSVSSWDID